MMLADRSFGAQCFDKKVEYPKRLAPLSAEFILNR